MTAITRSADHMYTYEGQTYRGVTGVLSVIDKSGPLMSWAARQTAEAAVALASTEPPATNRDAAWDEFLRDALASDGPISDADIKNAVKRNRPRIEAADPRFSAFDQLLLTVGAEGVIKALTSRSSWKRDEAAALGTEVHNLADLHVRGATMPAMSDTTRKRVEAYARWWEASGWVLRLSEAMLVNVTASYGGTLDLLAYDRDGATVLADIKTGKAVYNEAVLQLTAYGMAELIQPASDNVMVPGTVYPMPKVDRHVILHVTADAVREVEVPVGALEKIAWLACLDLATWRDSVKGKRL